MNYAELEKQYNVTKRTLYRWKKLGVNLNSPQQVAAHVAAQNASSPAAVTAAIQTLSKPHENHNKTSTCGPRGR